MADLLFVNGQIRALESKLLNKNQIDRMVGAANANDAFRVLIELPYADYIDELTKAQDFEKIVQQGLSETRQLLINETEDHNGLQFLWISSDLNNLKRAYQEKFIEEKTSMGEFVEENGYCLLGNLTEEEISKMVFKNDYAVRLPEDYVQNSQYINNIWEETKDFGRIEAELNRIHYKVLENISKKLNSSFLRNLFKLLVDIVNTKSLMRSLVIRKKELTKEFFIEGGTMEWDLFELTKDAKKINDFFFSTPFYGKIVIDFNEEDVAQQCAKIEQILDNEYSNELQEGQEGEIDSIQVPLAYFHKRMQNAKMLKFIMFSKFHGLTSDQIYDHLKTF